MPRLKWKGVSCPKCFAMMEQAMVTYEYVCNRPHGTHGPVALGIDEIEHDHPELIIKFEGTS